MTPEQMAQRIEQLEQRILALEMNQRAMNPKAADDRLQDKLSTILRGMAPGPVPTRVFVRMAGLPEGAASSHAVCRALRRLGLASRRRRDGLIFDVKRPS